MPKVGFKHSEDTRKRMSLSHSGVRLSKEHCKNISLANKGRKCTPEHVEKNRQARLGKKLSPAHVLKVKLAQLGKPRLYLRGEKHPLWKGGVTPLFNQIRKSIEYKNWRRAVFERDNYTCVTCGQRGVRLEADHIKSFSLHPELRFELSNGQTLCVACHRKTPNWGRHR